jgi:nucleoside-diphosphate-sugar epimerase
MKVFITGGTGFVGTNLLRKLQNSNHETLLLVFGNEQVPHNIKSKNEIVRGDLSNIKKWEKNIVDFSPDAAIHMAWEGIPDYSYKTSAKNLLYGIDLVKILGESGCKKIICTGSCWEYGLKQGKMSENMLPVSTNAFTAAKNSLNVIGSEIAKEHSMSLIWTRLFYVYGPLQRTYSLIPYVIKCIQDGKKPDIKTPETKNDFIFIEDVVKALIMILEKHEKSDIFNIGSGFSTQVNDIVDIVSKKYGLDLYIPHGRKNEKESVDFWADISKIKKEIGWTPKTSIHEGIEKTIECFNKKNLTIKEV